MIHIYRLHIKLNEEDHQKLKKLMRYSGLNRSQIIRTLLHESKIHERTPEELPILLREMSAIGNNINQIAKVANQVSGINQDQIIAIRAEYSRLWKAVRNI